jgi:hypothetical protein
MSFRNEHVCAHQDHLKPWLQFFLEEQLNVICNELANGAVKHLLSCSTLVSYKLQLLPLEKTSVFVNDKKMMTDVGPEVHF